jgi:hypothetical protein
MPLFSKKSHYPEDVLSNNIVLDPELFTVVNKVSVLKQKQNKCFNHFLEQIKQKYQVAQFLDSYSNPESAGRN